ncbi:MAG: serine hydrolase [Parachlamydia sp.]|nr:serine hydrolase [Parachlamydia sp.]
MMLYPILALLLLCTGSSYGDPQIEGTLRSFMQEKSIPGMAAVIVHEGKSEIYALGWADCETRRPVDAHTIFNLASVTKVFVTTAVASEILQGHMRLEEPAKDYIPGLREPNQRERRVADFGRVRIVDLATHTASLPHDPPLKIRGGIYPRQEILQYLHNWHPPYAIGSKYAYSNMSFGILGMTLEGVTGHTLEQVFEQEIFRPLGMMETELNVPPRLQALRAPGYLKTGRRSLQWQPNNWPGGGSLNSSASDMEKFLLANMGLAGPRGLIDAMELAHKTYFKVGEHLAMGLAWQTVQSQGLNIIDKNGGVAAYSCYIGFTQDNQIGVVLLTNKGRTEVTTLGRKLIHQLARKFKPAPDNRL